jgi:hypothetical protein
MAISAISPIVTPPLFIQPLAQLRQLHVEQSFNTALASTLNGIAAGPATLQAVTSQPQTVKSLEQALFNQWVSSLQSATAGTLGTSLDGVLAGSLGITGQTGVSELPFDTSNPQSLLFTARLVSLFNTVDLLGGDAGQSSQLGSLLDTLA